MTDIIEKIIKTKSLVTKSHLPSCDFVINPYVGCPHGCKYCYASFMKRFTKHTEAWGSFIDIKSCDHMINTHQLINKSIFLSSVTDCYNPFEKKYNITRKILEQLVDIDCSVSISTKSNLILRDVDLLKKCKDIKVMISLNTLDEKFKCDMDNASSIADRIQTLKVLHQSNIYTILFVSPIFPEITDYKQLIEQTKNFVHEYWFENLNLRGAYKKTILEYIAKEYSEFALLYASIYKEGKKDYWEQLACEIEHYCTMQNIKYINYFYHEQLVKKHK